MQSEKRRKKAVSEREKETRPMYTQIESRVAIFLEHIPTQIDVDCEQMCILLLLL